jgi:methylglutaconyl-CoA hydratase
MSLELIKENFIATVKLNRPDLHNAFNDELIEKLTKTFHKLDQDKSVRVIVLTGNGKSFCAGADLNWMKSMVNFSMEDNLKDSQKLAKLFSTINQCSKPVIGSINGAALGGGVGLVSVCDYVVTASSALYGFTEVRLGILPAVISPYVIAKIGESHARAWFLSGERFNALKAKEMNLIHEIVELEELEKRTQQLCASFLKAAPLATSMAKELVFKVVEKAYKNTASEVESYTCKVIAEKRISPEGQEGMNSLLNKNKPSWIHEEN